MKGLFFSSKISVLVSTLCAFSLCILNSQVIAHNGLSGNISITLKQGLWKLSKSTITYQDITLDLVCKQDRCEPEVWAFAPQFNQADHQGTVTIINSPQALRLQVQLTISPDPWQSLKGKAIYKIELQRQQNQFIGRYTGEFKNRSVKGEASGTVNPLWPKPIPNHLPINSREHPRLIFRRYQLPLLREKAKTAYGKAIIAQLKNTLAQPINYQGYVPNGGYHAAGYCFLSLLNKDSQAAETAWQIVQKSIHQPGPRLLEQSPIVAGVALAYDLCYTAWDRQHLKTVTRWLAQETALLIQGKPDGSWNPSAGSNWNARARGAAGLAALTILDEPEAFFSDSPNPKLIEGWLTIAERNIKRYLTVAIGDRGFGSEGDHYTTEPLILTVLPFLQAYANVTGKDLVQGSSAQWFLPHYLIRTIEKDGQLMVPTYGRHRRYAGGPLFAMGLETVAQPFLPGVLWFYNRHLGMEGDRSFGINSPYEAIYALTGYRDDIVPQNPAAVLNRVLVDEQKGFYVFRNQWQDGGDFVASISLKRQFLPDSWSFPDAGSFRIWGLGGRWANPGPSDGSRESENVPVIAASENPTTQPIFFQSNTDGSGIVSLKGDHWLRSFAVDYSGASGVPGLFVVVDRVMDKQTNPTWMMHTEGQVTIQGQHFTIRSPSGATMQGTFVTPEGVQLSFQPTEAGGTLIATGGYQFFVVMTVQNQSSPIVNISGTGLDAIVQVGGQRVSFQNNRIVLSPRVRRSPLSILLKLFFSFTDC